MSSESSGDEYTIGSSSRMRKRRKVTKKARPSRSSRNESAHALPPRPKTPEEPFDALLRALDENSDLANKGFERFVEPLLPDLIDASAAAQVATIKFDDNGQAIIPLSRLQSKAVSDQMSALQGPMHALVKRRLELHPDTLRAGILNNQVGVAAHAQDSATPMVPVHTVPANPEVMNGLYNIQTTPYSSSFLSRLRGFQPTLQESILAVDWDNVTPWMDLMHDIREHHTFMHPDREQAVETIAPIVYGTLQRHHLDQVHDLLRRAFWDGIDVSDALQYSPERCTVVATYKNLVIGVALLSSPQETYITYLAVKPGWDNAQVATSMLYFLIELNPHKDITLHVSIKNPAVLLYNRFGFKAEEFIVGFYEDYMDSQSQASKNAFRLRLRQP